MALHKYQCILHHENGLPEDQYVNVLYFDTNEPDDIMADIAAGYTAFSDQLANYINGMTIKAYEGVTGEPDYQQEFAMTGGLGNGVAEVAICLSYGADDVGDDTTARRRGRIYLGPLAFTESERPAPDLLTAVTALGTHFSQIGLATGTTWHMYSTTDAASHKIEHFSVDNAWDTQRRRGLAPTVRTTTDVQ